METLEIVGVEGFNELEIRRATNAAREVFERAVKTAAECADAARLYELESDKADDQLVDLWYAAEHAALKTLSNGSLLKMADISAAKLKLTNTRETRL